MVKVLVTGATGYIGESVANALRQHGHTVYGLVRTGKQKEANLLLRNEIIPVFGNINDVKTYTDIVNEVSVVVDTVIYDPKKESDTKFNGDSTSVNKLLMETVVASAKSSGVRKRYIYTSGLLVYGDYPNTVVDETYPLKGINRARINFEKVVTSQTDIDGVVIRPAWVYGGNGGHYTANWWTAGKNGEIVVWGNPNKMWSWVHIWDLADAYVRVVEASKNIVGGEVFDVGDDTRLTFRQLLESMAEASGTKGIVKEVPADKNNIFQQMCDVTVIVRSEKLRKLLGWNPKMGVFQDNMGLYYKSFKASHAD